MEGMEWRERASQVLLRPVPPLLRERDALWNICPWYFVDAYGPWLSTVDGGRYLDLEMGRGANILGYGHPVTEAARDSFRPGTSRTALYHPVEVELAEILVDLIPCAERVLFAKNGSDACTAAVRIARAATGRSVIISSGYHGFHDWCAAEYPDTEGFPDGFRGSLKNVALNDNSTLTRLFEEHQSAIAGIIIEPAHRVLPESGFLELARSLADEYGAILIFDEVVTAFRLSLGGAQSHFGVIPDLTCLGKAMANGLPLSALVGRSNLMETLDRSFFSMTFGHDNLVFAVAKACLNYLRETNALESIAQYGEDLRLSFDRAAKLYGLPARAVGFSSRLDLDFPPIENLCSERQICIFGSALLEHNILPTTSIFTCEMLDQHDISEATAAFEHGMAMISNA